MKIVVSNPEDGKTYQKELEKNQEKAIYGKKIKESVSGDSVGMVGYELTITGGSDKQGFPMRPDLHGTARKKILMRGGPGYKPGKKGDRMRKSVRGNTISDEIEQVNLVVSKKGKEDLTKMFGEKKEKAADEKKPEKK